MPAESPEAFAPTVDEMLALKRLEIENLSAETAILDHVPHRLRDEGFVTTNAEGRLTLTSKGLALARRP